MMFYLELVGHKEFRCGQAADDVDDDEENYGEQHGEVADQSAHKRREDGRQLEVLQNDG